VVGNAGEQELPQAASMGSVTVAAMLSKSLGFVTVILPATFQPLSVTVTWKLTEEEPSTGDVGVVVQELP
jgi:hypothetical protein